MSKMREMIKLLETQVKEAKDSMEWAVKYSEDYFAYRGQLDMANTLLEQAMLFVEEEEQSHPDLVEEFMPYVPPDNNDFTQSLGALIGWVDEQPKEVNKSLLKHKIIEALSQRPTMSKHYKCPKCHTRFSRQYPYKPADTKEIKNEK